MGRIYNSDRRTGDFRYSPTNGSPIDDRLVIDSYEGLFSNETWSVAGDIPVYTGMPVIVISGGIQSEIDDKSGIYVLYGVVSIEGEGGTSVITENGYQYIYDPSVSERIPPTGDPSSPDFVPGRSNKLGWTKVMSLYDVVNYLNFPVPSENKQYVLNVYADGTFDWKEYIDSGNLPEPEEENTVLTAVSDPGGGLAIKWMPQSSPQIDIPNPAINGNLVLVVQDYSDPTTWHWETVSAGGLEIEGYPDIDSDEKSEDGRWVMPGSANTKKISMSNLGEVIAVPLDEDEDERPEKTGDGQINPDRPFKLMLDYDKVRDIIIDGGDSSGDEVYYRFTEKYVYNGQTVKTNVRNLLAGSAIPSMTDYDTVITAGGSRYYHATLVNPPVYPTGTINEDITIEYGVDKVPEWQPTVKYALLSVTDGTIEDFPVFYSTDEELGRYVFSSVATPGTAEEAAPVNSKFFYTNDGTSSAAVYGEEEFNAGVACVLKIEGEAELDSASYWRTGTASEWVPVTPSSNPSLAFEQIPGRQGEYLLKQSYSTSGYFEFVYRLRVRKS